MRLGAVAVILMAMLATPAHADRLRLNVGLAGEMSWERANGEETGADMASPLGVLELTWRPARNIDLFVMHISSITDTTDNYGINLLGLRLSFGN